MKNKHQNFPSFILYDKKHHSWIRTGKSFVTIIVQESYTVAEITNMLSPCVTIQSSGSIDLNERFHEVYGEKFVNWNKVVYVDDIVLLPAEHWIFILSKKNQLKKVSSWNYHSAVIYEIHEWKPEHDNF